MSDEAGAAPATMKVSSLEDVHKLASDKGMAVVDEQTTTDDLESRFHDVLIEADELSRKQDPETEPYKSKYEANKMMEEMHKQVLARKLVSQVNNKRADFGECGRMTALLDYRIGANCMNTEEPHRAQPRLEDALSFFMPDLIDKANAICDDDAGDEAKQAAGGDHGDTADVSGGSGGGGGGGDNAVAEQTAATQQPVEPPLPPSTTSPCAASEGDSAESESGMRLRAGALEFSNEVLDSLNQLGILWCNRAQFKRAQLYLHTAETVYSRTLDARKAGQVRASPSQRKQTETLHTHTLFFLAQVTGHLGDAHASALYCQRTLQRQLEPAYEDLDVVDWVNNCVTLAGFHASAGRFRDAAHCFAACAALIERSGATADADTEMVEKLAAARAEAERKRGALYAQVLQIARERQLLDLPQEPDSEKGPAEEEFPAFCHLPGLASIDGAPLDPEKIDYERACAAFKAGNGALQRALSHFVLDGFASDHVEILQQQSAMYRSVAAFERDEKKQLAMHQRRVALLEPILGELNERVFHATCCQIAFELGECYGDMLELKMARIEAKTQQNKLYTPSATETRKCNTFADKGVQNFARFVRLLNQLLEPEPNGKGASPPAPGAWAGDHAESLGPYLRAHFHMARLLGRYLTPDPRAAVPGMKRSLDTYRFLVGYVPKARDAVSQPELFKEELHICEQMAELLPEKINQMHYNGRTMG